MSECCSSVCIIGPGLPTRNSIQNTGSALQADIYSFGLVLWELLTRETPENTQLRELDTPAECPEVRRDPVPGCASGTLQALKCLHNTLR